jgi:hypothetical protein
MNWLIVLLEWLDRKCGGTLTWDEQRYSDHLIDTTPRRRKNKWL